MYRKEKPKKKKNINKFLSQKKEEEQLRVIQASNRKRDTKKFHRKLNYVKCSEVRRIRWAWHRRLTSTTSQLDHNQTLIVLLSGLARRPLFQNISSVHDSTGGPLFRWVLISASLLIHRLILNLHIDTGRSGGWGQRQVPSIEDVDLIEVVSLEIWGDQYSRWDDGLQFIRLKGEVWD